MSKLQDLRVHHLDGGDLDGQQAGAKVRGVEVCSPDPGYTVRDQLRMSRARRYFEWQSRWAERELGRRVLEVGCGVGNFTRRLLDREFVVGLDVEDACVRIHRETFASHKNVQCFHMDILDERVADLREFQPDSIVCLNVLEHVRDDRKALEHMRDLLPAGGRAVFILPAFESLYGRIDRNLGHYRRYSKTPWRNLAESLGFRVSVCRYMNSVGFFGWWANSHLFRREAQSENQIAWFDSLIVPVLSRIEGAMEPPVGQSLFTVLVKEQRPSTSVQPSST